MGESGSRLPPHMQALSDLVGEHASHPVLGGLHRELQALSQQLPADRSLVFEPPRADPRSMGMHLVFKPSAAGTAEVVKCPVPGCKGWRPK